MLRCNNQRHIPAIAVADDVRSLHAEVTHDAGDVGCHSVERVAA
jgi:hypothetical protein